MARKTLGAFINRSKVEAPAAFYRDAWNLLNRGPAILRPRHVGNWEPLKKVEVVDLEKVVATSFIFANGRKMRGWVSPPAFLEHQYYDVTIHLDVAERDLKCADDVYDWLMESFAFSVAYMGTPSRELFESNLELHQMLNSGLVEISLHRALANRHLLDRVDMAV